MMQRLVSIADMIDNIVGTGTRNGYIADNLDLVAFCRKNARTTSRRVQRRVWYDMKHDEIEGLRIRAKRDWFKVKLRAGLQFLCL
jgi:hypothetical protein